MRHRQCAETRTRQGEYLIAKKNLKNFNESVDTPQSFPTFGRPSYV